MAFHHGFGGMPRRFRKKVIHIRDIFINTFGRVLVAFENSKDEAVDVLGEFYKTFFDFSILFLEILNGLYDFFFDELCEKNVGKKKGNPKAPAFNSVLQ
jgi:hypothetical protein